jgi:hypothetical protein
MTTAFSITHHRRGGSVRGPEGMAADEGLRAGPEGVGNGFCGGSSVKIIVDSG